MDLNENIGAVAALCTLGLTVTETASLEVILFEELSAMGTVGLSLGLTPHLSSAGKCIIILSMLVGRIGPFTFLWLWVDVQSGTSTPIPKSMWYSDEK